MVAALQEPGKPAAHFNNWPNSQGFDSLYEEHEPVELKIEGKIPSYASGTFYRTGMGPRQVEGPGKTYTVNHWFDEFGQMHRFRIHAAGKNGEPVRVTHNSRIVSDKLIARVKKTGKLETMTFGQKYDPCKTFFRKVQSVFQTDEAPVDPGDFGAVVTLSTNHPGLTREGQPATGPNVGTGLTTLLAKTDNTKYQVMDPETLEPTGLANQSVLHPDLKGAMSGAHAKSDPKTGDVYNYNLDFGKTGTYRVFKAEVSTGKTSILATVEHDPAYIHSIFLTENYVILCVWNSYFSMGGLSLLWKTNLMDAMHSDPSKPSKWFVIDKKTPEQGGRGVVATYESDAFYAFHSINAYEQPSSTNEGEIDIVADVLTYADMEGIKRFYIDTMKSDSPTALPSSDKAFNIPLPRYQRYTLPSIPSTPIAQDKPLKAIKNPFLSEMGEGLELPVMNAAYVTKPYRYTYAMHDTGLSTFFDGLAKVDVTTGEITRWSKHGHTASEPIFVADPARTDKEDGGVLLSVVLDGTLGKSYMLVLDAETMQEMGRAHVDGAVGFGFHGLFSGDKVAVGKENGLDF